MRTVPHPGRTVDLQSIDLYDPEGTADRLAVLFVHGGGWYGGDRSQMAAWATLAASLGHPVGSTGYRLAEDTGFDDKLADVIAGWRILAAEFPAAESVCVVGSSAGAHLVTALTLADPDLVPELPISAVLSFNGPGSVRREKLARPECWDRVSQLDMSPAQLDLLDEPVTVRPLDWSFVHAEDENWFPHEHVADLVTRLDAAGHRTETTVVPGTSHGFCYGVLAKGGEQAEISRAAAQRLWGD